MKLLFFIKHIFFLHQLFYPSVLLLTYIPSNQCRLLKYLLLQVPFGNLKDTLHRFLLSSRLYIGICIRLEIYSL